MSRRYNDASKLAKGLALVIQESAKLQGPEVERRAALAIAHLSDVVHTFKDFKFTSPFENAPHEQSQATHPADAYATWDGRSHTFVAPEPVNHHKSTEDEASSVRKHIQAQQPIASEPISVAAADEGNRPPPAAELTQPSAPSTPSTPLTSKAVETSSHPTSSSKPAEAPPVQAVASQPEPQPSPSPAAQDVKVQPAAAAPAPPRREFRERKVPAGPMSRVWGFGTMAAGMAMGAAGEAVKRGLGFGDSPSKGQGQGQGGSDGSAPPQPFGKSVMLTEANVKRLADGLSRMRGAALKLGQMLSLADDDMLPVDLARIMERVRSNADVMPRWQLEKSMSTALGPDWRSKFAEFDDKPMAAASIGQVHRARTLKGRDAVVKVQYPGVAQSIDSDLDNLKRLVTVMDIFPKGLYLDSVLQVARKELKLECDYGYEAACQTRFRELMADDNNFIVPEVFTELSAGTVLTSEFVPGIPIDQVETYPQEIRDDVAKKLLRLTLRELFEFRFMQTDPNWGNFLYDPESGRLGLLDFGAAREYPKPFVDDYLRLVWAAAHNDRQTIRDVSLSMGFLTGFESSGMIEAHVDAGLAVGEPFQSYELYDFTSSDITKRVNAHGETFANERLTPPPPEIYSLHRRLAGAYLMCIKLKARIAGRGMLEWAHNQYTFGEVGEGGDGAGATEGIRAQHDRVEVEVGLKGGKGDKSSVRSE